MEPQRAIFLGGLTYIMYGGLSMLSLGSFVPPIPIKPLLFLVVTVIALALSKSVSARLRMLFGTFVLLYTLSNVYFWEMFFNHEFIEQNVVGQLNIFVLFAVFMLVFFNVFFVTASFNNQRQRILLHCIFVMILPFFVAWPSLKVLDVILSVLAILFVAVSFVPQIQRSENYALVFMQLLLLNALMVAMEGVLVNA
jgi:hypothetical protein